MKRTMMIVAILVTIGVSGCQTAPMTAKSKLDVSGPINVVEKTTTTTVNPDGTKTTKIVEVSSEKTPSAGDLELKKTELKARRDVAKARANRSGFWASNPSYGYFGGSGSYGINVDNSQGGGYVTPYGATSSGGVFTSSGGVNTTGGGYVTPYGGR